MSKKALNILYINHYYRSNDSASISSYEIARGLKRIGHDVVVLTHDPCPLYGDLNRQVKVVRVRLRFPYAAERSRFLKFLRCTVAYLVVLLAGFKLGRKKRINCVFSQHHNFHFATLTTNILSSFLNVPHVVKVQDGVPFGEAWVGGPLERVYNSYVMRILNGYALRRAKYVLALSRELKSLLMKIFQIPSDQIVTVPNTVSIFSAEPARIEEMRRQLGLQKEKIMVFVGVAKGRGVEVLIKALPSIVSEGLAVKLLIVGHSANAKRRLVGSLEAEKHVQFIGPIHHSLVPIVISMSDVAIGPLFSDMVTVGAVPRKILEYMACGKPVICSRGSVSQDLLINGYNGISVKPGDVDELSSAIINLMKDEKLAKEIGSNAREHVSTYYGEVVLAKKLTTLMDCVA